MVSSAPRYDERIVAAIYALDDPREPIAETCRRVGRVAAQLGLPRPSYVHLRRLVQAERARRAAIAEIRDDVITDLVNMRLIDAYELADRFARVPGRRR
jgi:hypothetical protein